MKPSDVILTPVPQADGRIKIRPARLGFLALLPISRIMGNIGSISPNRHNRLLKTLSDYLIHSTVI